MKTINEYKDQMLQKIDSGEITIELVLATKPDTKYPDWNCALKELQKDIINNTFSKAYSDLSQQPYVPSSSLSRKGAAKNAARKSGSSIKKGISSSPKIPPPINLEKAREFGRSTAREKDAHKKMYIDEGIAGDREENKSMREKQSWRNRKHD